MAGKTSLRRQPGAPSVAGQGMPGEPGREQSVRHTHAVHTWTHHVIALVAFVAQQHVLRVARGPAFLALDVIR